MKWNDIYSGFSVYTNKNWLLFTPAYIFSFFFVTQYVYNLLGLSKNHKMVVFHQTNFAAIYLVRISFFFIILLLKFVRELVINLW